MPNPDAEQVARIAAAALGAGEANKEAAPEAAAAAAAIEATGDQTKKPANDEGPLPLIEIEDGQGNKRSLTPDQIRGTLDRYRALNHKHSEFKPVIELAEKLIEAAPNAKPGDVAKYLTAALKGMSASPEMGAGAEGKKPAELPADDDLAKWEKDNAASLPPGYREMGGAMKHMLGGMGEIQRLLKGVLAANRQNIEATGALSAQASQQMNEAVKRNIAANLDAAQQHLGLPDDAGQDFVTFAFERGYTLEDFADGDLAKKVMGDFSAVRGQPEMDRLRAAAKRRQAFSGSLGAAPANTQTPPTKPGDAQFNRLIDKAMG